MKNKYAILKMSSVTKRFSLLEGGEDYNPITFKTLEEADKYANAYEIIYPSISLKVISIDSIHE